jgi:hypothetical protein
MGWRFRKSINFGPLRINFSRKGAGVSVGGGGFRVGHDASGRNYSQTSIPGTGIYRRDYYKSNPSPVPAPTVPPTPQTNFPKVASGAQKPMSASNKYLFLLVGLAALFWIVLEIVGSLH